MPVELALELIASLESFPEIAAGFGETLRRTAKPERAAGDAEVFSGAAALDAVALEWRAIEREGAFSTPFQSFAVAEAAMSAHLAHGHEPHIVVVREHGETRAILPLVLTSMAGNRVLRFLGDPLIQYGDAVLSRAGSEAHLVQALLAAGKIGADAALLRKVRSDAKIAPLLSRTLGMPLPPMLRGADVAVRPVRVHGQPLFLASVGGTVARDALLASSVRGVERILRAN